MKTYWPYAVFTLAIAYAVSPWASAGIALAAGIAIALCFGNPLAKASGKLSKTLLQASVVFLGFKFDLMPVLQVGAQGFIFALITILATFGLGWLIGKWLKVPQEIGILVSSGTAICGGSAIAAVSSTLSSKDEDVAVSIGTVFLLNAIALFIFPPLGHLLALDGHAFGIWSGIAIHDISSVAGSAAAYGQNALEIAMPVKLSRALWIAPMAIAIGYIWSRSRSDQEGQSGGFKFPWFILMFVAASGLRSLVPALQSYTKPVELIAVAGFTLTLFLIGGGISREALKKVGWRPLAMGIALWAFISLTTLACLNFLAQ
ncbi:MAG: putative sulfate exporter family transporter [Fimbriimonadaceae bacterium]|nr:putative sulfate exporter family transporter [Fimbriimonadaceae bacterium]